MDSHPLAPDADALFDRSALLALALDAEGRLVRVSARLADLLGRDEAELRGRPVTALMPGPAARLFDEDLMPTLARTGRIEAADLALGDGSGREVPVRLSAYVERDEAGAFRRGVAILTDRREALDAVRRLEEKAAEAEEASEAKSRFLAAMSHEIRTPMNAILGFAQLLDLSDLDATRRGHVQAIRSAGESLMTLLADLLDLSQVEAGRMRVEPRVVDVADMLDEVVGWWRGSAADKGLSLELERDSELPARILADRGRVEQVLNNYLGNAVKFTVAGGIALRASPVETAAGGPAIRFAVADTGLGIPGAELGRLFDPFVQVEGDGTGGHGGWGLGLSICATIAEAVGGEVGVESVPGAGSVFRFDLPVRLPPAEDLGAGASGEPAASEAPPLRILLAEDDGLNQQVMEGMLAGMGHAVTTVADGFALLEALEREPFDLVVLDVMMPGLDGLGALRRLRETAHAGRDVPVIGCSAHVSPESDARYRAMGMAAFLPKPVARDALADAIAAAIAAVRPDTAAR